MHIPHLHIHFVDLLKSAASAFSWHLDGTTLTIGLGSQSSPLHTKIDVRQVAANVLGAVNPAVRGVLPVVLRAVADAAQKHVDTERGQ